MSWGKSTCALELLAELAASFVRVNHSYMKEWPAINGYSDGGTGQPFLAKEQSMPIILRKATDRIYG